MADIVLFSLQLTLGILLPWLVVRSDMLRLDAERLARAWNDASFWCAIVVFGPLCLPFHFVKTRRSALGVLLGVGWMALVLWVIALVASMTEALALGR